MILEVFAISAAIGAGHRLALGSRGSLLTADKPIGYSIWRFDGIERLPPKFLREFSSQLLALGVDPNAALSVIKHESNFKPDAKNEQVVDGQKRLIAAGLIQWINSTAKSYGTSLDELLKMDAMGQLPFVIKYWQTMAKQFPSMKGRWTPEQALRAVFFPSSVGKPADTIIGNAHAEPKDDSDKEIKKAKFIRLVYEQNKSLDENHDGTITAGEVDDSAKVIYLKAKQREPLRI